MVGNSIQILKDYRVAVFDMDGTTIGPRNVVYSGILEAIEYLKQCNIESYIATGRTIESLTKSELLDFYEKFNPNIICYNGNAIYNRLTERLDIINTVPNQYFYEFYKRYKESVDFLIDDAGRLYTNSKRGALKATMLFGIKRSKISVEDFENYQPKEILTIIVSPKNNAQNIYDELDNIHYPASMIEKMDNYRYRIIPENTCKSNGVFEVIKPLGYDLLDVVAFGNDLNDIGLFQRCGIGIAVKDSEADLKKIARLNLRSELGDTILRLS